METQFEKDGRAEFDRRYKPHHVDPSGAIWMEAIRWAQCQRMENGRDELKLRLDQSLANGLAIREALRMKRVVAASDVISKARDMRFSLDQWHKVGDWLQENPGDMQVGDSKPEYALSRLKACHDLGRQFTANLIDNGELKKSVERWKSRAEKTQIDSVNQGLEIARLKGELAKANAAKCPCPSNHIIGPLGGVRNVANPLPVEEKKEPEQPEKELVECDCNCTDICPQGHTGAAAKCKIWRTVRPIK